MRALIAGLIAILALNAPALAYDSPKALVEAIYAPYQAAGAQQDLTQYYSERLKGLFAQKAAKVTLERDSNAVADANADATPPLGFNPFIDAEHALLLDLAITEPVVLGDVAVLTVSFHNFDHPTLLTISAIKEADGWKVDDISSISSTGQNWMLSWLLLYDPWDVK